MIQKLLSLRKSEGINQTLITGFSNYSSAFVSALAIIVISRNLGPTVFGEFSAAFSLATVLSKINDAGITIATQKFASQSKNKKEVKSIIKYGYRLKIIISIAILVITLLFSNLITATFKFSHPLIVPVSVICGLTLVYYEQVIATLLATRSFLKAAYANILQATLKLVTAIVVSFKFGNDLLPILSVYLLAPGVPVALKSLLEPRWLSATREIPISKKNKQKMISLARHSALLVFVLGVLDSVGVLFVKAYLSSYDAGLLGGISRIALLFTLIGVSFSQVLNNRVSRYLDKKNLDLYIRKAMYLSLASLVSFFIALPFLPLVINLTIGSEYMVALAPMMVLLASVFMYIVSVPIAALFYSFDKNSYFSISGVLQLFTIVVANFTLVPSFGVMGSALAQLTSRSVLLLFTIYFAYSSYREKFSYER